MYYYYIAHPSKVLRNTHNYSLQYIVLDTAVVCTHFIKSYGFTYVIILVNSFVHICVLIFLSFSFVKVMAGSGNLQIFRLLRYLRGRMSAEGQVNYGLQMAVSIVNSFAEQICFSLKSNTRGLIADIFFYCTL